MESCQMFQYYISILLLTAGDTSIDISTSISPTPTSDLLIAGDTSIRTTTAATPTPTTERGKCRIF